MSTERTYNSSFWTREEDEIFENTLAIYCNDKNLFMKMKEELLGKSLDDITDHINILIEDIDAIESEHVLLPNYPEMQSDANQNLKPDVEWRKGTPWTAQEHRHCVITRTASQVASHAHKFFKRVEANNKGNRRARTKASVLDITSVDAEAAGTSQVPNTVDMIGPTAEDHKQWETLAMRAYCLEKAPILRR
ncbi:transcription factor MYBS1-like [Solanum dulcamara]|uniref:transcription factor MYBS1-like n=1 Tax=Solanum dulcamara TaxID=45834 RepID=UPI0024869F81|nr:transcription factor MYBS1-like [Solanum dulcamara]